MDVTPQISEGAPLISKYGNGGFVVAGQRVEGSVLLTRTQSQSIELADIAAIQTKQLVPITESEELPELVLFGTGSQTALLPKAIKSELDDKQIGYDVMDTGAACRTFNILLSEDRRVAAVLIAV